MAFEKKTWVNVPDPNNLPDIPEGQDSLALFDADNMNRIEEGVEDALNRISDSFNQMALQNIHNLVFERIHNSQIWTVPKALNQTFKVFVVGGGGGAGYGTACVGGGGGGGGFITINDNVHLVEGEKIEVICGAGGASDSDGGTTVFGDITAEGGKAGKPMDMTVTPYKCGDGGDGGAGGGGGGQLVVYRYNAGTDATATAGNGGNGAFGGGGGGGITCGYTTDTATHSRIVKTGLCGTGGAGGTHGGRGGAVLQEVNPISQRHDFSIVDALLNLNNIPSAPVFDEYTMGDGEGGLYGWGGQGLIGSTDSQTNTYTGCGGGGGYASVGGQGGYASGGGGGGYFGQGGIGSFADLDYNIVYYMGGGGGGGFFCDGGAGYRNTSESSSYAGGGGGFFAPGGSGYQARGGNGGVLIMYIKED